MRRHTAATLISVFNRQGADRGGRLGPVKQIYGILGTAAGCDLRGEQRLVLIGDIDLITGRDNPCVVGDFHETYIAEDHIAGIEINKEIKEN